MDMKRLFRVTVLSAFALSACSKEAPKLSLPPLQEYVVDNDATTLEFAPGIDILFVIDNSGSMMEHQQNLSANASRFAAAFQSNGQLDYHMGVVTTDMNERGRLYSRRGGPAFIDRNTPDGLRILAANMLVGTSGSAIEASFQPVHDALNPPTVNGANQGFYREDAMLAIVFITDAEDQSNIPGDLLLQELIAMKGGDATKVLAYGAIAVSGRPNSECPRDSGEPFEIEDFLGKVSNAGKNVFSLCDPQFGDYLAQIGQDVVDRIGYTILLNRPPDLKTVKMLFGTQEILPDAKTGWSYDPERNALILGSEIKWSEQPKGTKLKVTFATAKFKPRD